MVNFQSLIGLSCFLSNLFSSKTSLIYIRMYLIIKNINKGRTVIEIITKKNKDEN
jgi:hypothetical protein